MFIKKFCSVFLTFIFIISTIAVNISTVYATDAKSVLNSAKLTPTKTGYTDVDNKISSIIAEGKSKTKSTYELVKWLYDYCVYNTEYGYDYGENTYMKNKTYGYVTPFPDWLVYEAVGPLFYGKGVCNNYAAEFMLITRALGFESYYFSGETRKAGGGYTGHAWCEIKINGINYIFDTQVEDNVAATKGKIIYLYFCKTESEMKERYIWNWESINSKIAELGIEPKLKSLEEHFTKYNIKTIRAVSFENLKTQLSNVMNSGDTSEYLIILNGAMNRDEVKKYLDFATTDKVFRGRNIPEVLKNKYMSGDYESLKAYYVYEMIDNSQGVDSINFRATYEPQKNLYIYDEKSLADNIVIPTEKLEKIETKDDATEAVEEFVEALNSAEKADSDVKDLVLLYSEEAVSLANTIETDEYNFEVSDKVLKENLECDISDVTKVIKDGKMALDRTASTQISVSLPSDKKVTVKSSGSSGKVKSIKCRTDYTSVVIPNKDGLKVSLESQGKNKVKIDFDNKNTTSVIKVNFPNISGNGKNYAVVDESGNVLGGKYNPITDELEVKIKESGIFSVQNNAKSFDDIKDKSNEVREAIELLASKGIINGTSDNEFSPDSTITRAEVTSLICRIISKYDPNEDGGFDDVFKTNWYFGAAGSGKKEGIINGYANNTFRGEYVIPKIQIVSMAARVLRKEMNYNSSNDVATTLSEFSDSSNIADWGKGDVALAKEANLIVKRKDNTFVPNDEMTRGDAAVILKRLYDKVW